MMPATHVWPGGEHPFRLALAQLEGLQQKTEAGPEWLLLRFQSGQWTATEAFEVLRFGLIGGGMEPAQAGKMVRDAFERHALIGFKVPAMSILMAALYGPADDPAGKTLPAGAETLNPENADAGSSAPSTD